MSTKSRLDETTILFFEKLAFPANRKVTKEESLELCSIVDRLDLLAVLEARSRGFGIIIMDEIEEMKHGYQASKNKNRYFRVLLLIDNESLFEWSELFDTAWQLNEVGRCLTHTDRNLRRVVCSEFGIHQDPLTYLT
jgi:hypothetical protein